MFSTIPLDFFFKWDLIFAFLLAAQLFVKPHKAAVDFREMDVYYTVKNNISFHYQIHQKLGFSH